MFLPSGVSFNTTFLKNSGRCNVLGIATCLRTVVGGKPSPINFVSV